MAKMIIIHNCWDCPYRDNNTGGQVPHYCRLQHSSMDDSGFPQYCPIENDIPIYDGQAVSKSNIIYAFYKALEETKKRVKSRN